MNKDRSDLRICLLQVRKDEITKKEELDEFVRYSKLNREQFIILDSFNLQANYLTILESIDGLFIGGTSDVSVLKIDKYPFIEDIIKIVNFCLEKEMPVLASCFGFQVVVDALGGKMIRDEENMEMGSYLIELTDEGKKDILFNDTPEKFYAISGHAERAEKLPSNTIHLASSEKCLYQAFKLTDKPVYAFQFHPEVDTKDLIDRITRYKKRYFNNEKDFLEVYNRKNPTTESNKLIEKFVDRIILGNNL